MRAIAALHALKLRASVNSVRFFSFFGSGAAPQEKIRTADTVGSTRIHHQELANEPASTAATRSSTRRPVSQIRNKISHEEIQRLAYHIYLSRGGEEGHELEDWLQAERELKSKQPA